MGYESFSMPGVVKKRYWRIRGVSDRYQDLGAALIRDWSRESSKNVFPSQDLKPEVTRKRTGRLCSRLPLFPLRGYPTAAQGPNEIEHVKLTVRHRSPHHDSTRMGNRIRLDPHNRPRVIGETLDGLQRGRIQGPHGPSVSDQSHASRHTRANRTQTCAMTVNAPRARMYVLFPPMLGPVTTTKLAPSLDIS